MWVNVAWRSETFVIALQIFYVIVFFIWVKVWWWQLIFYMRYCSRILGRNFCRRILSSFMSSIWYCKCLLQLSSDIELNPGPKPNSCKSFSICDWNLNSITSYNVIKLWLLKAYNSIHKLDIIYLAETYLNSETLSNVENLRFPDDNLIRDDHPSNTKRWGVCIYFKESLPLRICNVSYLSEYICYEFMISNILCNFISIYRSPSQSSDEYEDFFGNLDLSLEVPTQKNSFLTVIIGDFNVNGFLPVKQHL